MTRVAIRCVLFDLDGTLADTALDMIAALNRLRAEENLAPMPFQALRNHVSHGSKAMVTLGFGEQQTAEAYQRRITRFLDHYAGNLCSGTRLFDGAAELLKHIEHQGLRWGLVTNKPGWLTDPLMVALGLADRASCIISGDTTPERKPHPLPLLTAAEQCGAPPDTCLYVGDAERDIAAGNAAGMTTLVARWGYIDASQSPETWQADGHLSHPLDTLRWLNGQ